MWRGENSTRLLSRWVSIQTCQTQMLSIVQFGPAAIRESGKCFYSHRNQGKMSRAEVSAPYIILKLWRDDRYLKTDNKQTEPIQNVFTRRHVPQNLLQMKDFSVFSLCHSQRFNFPTCCAQNKDFSLISRQEISDTWHFRLTGKEKRTLKCSNSTYHLTNLNSSQQKVEADVWRWTRLTCLKRQS